jgi:oxygen-independent coproporphyrinogen III oxidase
MNNMPDQDYLLQKYNVPVPRYTSYPTVPHWYAFENTGDWLRAFREGFQRENSLHGISLYIHLPFCESLCTFCGCNKRITTNHGVEDIYIKALISEWEMYCRLMDEMPIIRELHLGGGTPTFFSPSNLRRLIMAILQHAIVHPQFAFSIEGHPNNTTIEHLKALSDTGFQRISFGVQDNDPVVQRAINRIQPLENVQRVTEQARAIGFTSVNYDLIYGLPFQTLEGARKTMEEVLALRPDRIAFYSYAHVPWKQKAQRLFDENDLPGPSLKWQLYLQGKQFLTAGGYLDIGMDHFALPGDELYTAYLEGRLHRNFMGYTVSQSKFLVGLGVSAISDTGAAYAQNHRELENYYRYVNQGQPAVHKGYILREEDQHFKQYILDIACNGKTTLQPDHAALLQQYVLPRLRQLQQDGIVIVEGNEVHATPAGRQFIRNICHAFDVKAHTSDLTGEQVFSKAI